jgi:hypothetical protein
MRTIVKPNEEARKRIMSIARGMESKNTIFISIFTGEVVSLAYYRSDKGEELRGQPKDCYEFHYEFHPNKSNKFMTYKEIDEEIEEAYSQRVSGLEEEIKELQTELAKMDLPLKPWESESEVRGWKKNIENRLEELGVEAA